MAALLHLRVALVDTLGEGEREARTMMAGALLRCSLISSVTAPRPILVKKLIEKRVFLGLSIGKMLPR